MIKRLLAGAMALVCAVALPMTGWAQTYTNNPDGSFTPDVVTKPTANAVNSFRQTCATTAAALGSNKFSNGFVVKAMPTNVGTVYVGQAAVSVSTGYPLSPGEPISYGAANSNQAYIVCTNATDQVVVTGN